MHASSSFDSPVGVPLERFSSCAAKAIRCAHGASHFSVKLPQVHVDHLLLGIVHASSETAMTRKRLEEVGIDAGNLREVLRTVNQVGFPDSVAESAIDTVPDLSDHAAQAIRNAERIRASLDGKTIRTHMLLAGILEVEECSVVRAVLERWPALRAAAEPASAETSPPTASSATETKTISLEVSPNLEIPDADPTGIQSIVEVTDSRTVLGLQVRVEITHTWSGDLLISLIDPGGHEVILKERSGSNENDVRMTFDQSNTPGLSHFVGVPAAGAWSLHVADHAATDVGRIESWGLQLTVGHVTGEAVRAAPEHHFDVWQRAFAPNVEGASRLPQFQGDGSGGIDLLNIRRDVHAFASLISSENLEPPLSIGLFGDWGSGKSFFMQKIREEVSEISDQAKQRRRKNEETLYLSRIIQIEFNAWHYVESNLWASLVEHIFRNLRFSEDEKENEVEERRRFLLEKLDDAIARRVEAEDKVEAAHRDREERARKLRSKRASLDVRTRKAETLRLRDVLEDFTFSTELAGQLRTVLTQLGIPRALETKEQLVVAITDARDVVNRGRALWMTLIHSPGLAARLFGLLSVLVLVPVAGWLLPKLATSEFAKDVTALVGQSVTFVGGLAAWLARQSHRASATLTELEKTGRVVDRKLAAARSNHEKAVEKASQAVQRAITAVEIADRELSAAENEVADAKSELAKLGASRRLSRFIEERCASEDYRKHLGLLAMIRRDFLKLNQLMLQARSKCPAGEIEPLKEDDEHRIDRIVLYIDDLDRCPPKKVIDVLQAIHLLLAFPLFVVVVGVDARWVSRSLEESYGKMWRRYRRKDDDPNALISDQVATPQDYLEKIFQIPFWLEPMSVIVTEKYLEGLLAKSLPVPTSVPRAAASEETTQRKARVEHRGRDDSLRKRAHEVRTTETLKETEKRPQKEERSMSPEQLRIQRIELDFMKTLAPLVSRSPRAVKRYVNVYRLIRAGIADEQVEVFLGTKAAPGPCQGVLFLLGVVTGAPTLAQRIFHSVSTSQPDVTLQSFFESFDSGFDEALKESEEWQRVRPFFSRFASGRGSQLTLAQLQPLLDQVGRYSFRVGRVATIGGGETTETPADTDGELMEAS